MRPSIPVIPHKSIHQLSDREHGQNESYLIGLKNIFSDKGFELSKNLEKILLEKTRKAGIWLRGLSPLVFEAFMTSMTLALANKAITDEERAEVVMNNLNLRLGEENIFQRTQYQDNSYRVLPDEKKGVVKNLNYHVLNKSLPQNYWLVADDIVALTEIVNQEPGFHVIMTTAQANANEAFEQARGLISQGAKVVYVPIETGGGHWELKIFDQNERQDGEDYNPPGDGKCGDHVVAKILCDAGQRANKTFYPPGVTEKSSADAVRQASVNLTTNIDLARQSASLPTNSILSRPIPSVAARFRASALPKANPVSHVPHVSPAKSRFVSELERMTSDLNCRADTIIRQLRDLSPAEQKARWEQFDRTEWKSVEQKAKSAASQGNHLGYGHLFSAPANKVDTTSQPAKANSFASAATPDFVETKGLGL